MKRKSFIFVALFAMFSMSVSADQNWGGYFQDIIPECVQLQIYQDGGEGRPKDHRSQELLPELGYDGSTFVLATSYELDDVAIVIRDEDGTVLYYDVVSCISDYYMFQLSDSVIADMFSIELYYGDHHLYGEF